MTVLMRHAKAADAAGSARLFAEAAAQARDGDLSVTAVINAAESFRGLGGSALARDLYRIWLAHNAVHPLAFAVRFNFAASLAETGEAKDLQEARLHLQAAVAARPDFAPASINLGSVLERLDDRVGAVQAWQDLANRLAPVTQDAISHRCTALNQMGRLLEIARVHAPAEARLRASLELDPAQRMVVQHFVSLRQARCQWPVLPEDGPAPRRDLLACISPLSVAALFDDPVLQLANARAYSAADGQPEGVVTVGAWPPPARARTKKTRLRVGYVSSDFREHAVGYLTAELFELHDRAAVECFAYYCGPARDDGMKARFQASAEHWIDISGMTDRQAAARIVADRIDILVDVNGYTKDGRPKLFALRPAPCIVNWLGFPGTLGSPHHNYLIADEFIVPPEDEAFYSEKVLRLPCYQPNDRKRGVAAAGLTRAQAGLPDDAVVFSAFNGAQKITPEVFAVWMDILRAVPAGVLWVLAPEDDTADSLRSHARQAGIDAARLVFAGRMANADHLARFRLADLFLDTAPYGAHTTASDALWMGLPVLTRAGNAFAARVCGSLVRAAGLPELVCADWDSYRDTAIALARAPERLAALRARLRAGRDTCVLFDTPALVRSLEKLYARIWADHMAGRTPVPALRHLSVYHRIGCEPDRPSLPDRAALLGFYRQHLAYCHAVSKLPADGLLWSEAFAG
jgi:predicted O-linked N-acetylglucosamine transferase (SPINDLY family)